MHGSASSLARKSVANPIGATLTVAMMLEYLGFNEARGAVEKAVCESIAQGETTRNLGGFLSTTEAGGVLSAAASRVSKTRTWFAQGDSKVDGRWNLLGESTPAVKVARFKRYPYMGSKGKEATQRLLAIVVIISMMTMMNIPAPVIIFFAIVVYFVWRAVQRSEQQEIGGIFDFYEKAHNILRDEEKRWYGFEIEDVIQSGERILDLMQDAPPLVYFTLGSLASRSGDHERAVTYLSSVVEDERGDELRCLVPSPLLKRYVNVLRKIEQEPAVAAPTMAAVRSLERARRSRAVSLLAENRERLSVAAAQASLHASPQASPQIARATSSETASASDDLVHKPAASNTQLTSVQRLPIAEVLRDVYEEEKKTA